MSNTWRPAAYHGHGKTQDFFEGWYFKLVDATGRQRLAIIPGVFLGKQGRDSHAFVQTLDGATGRTTYHRYPLAAFWAAPDRFDIRVSVLGHIQRGGSPTVTDRILGVLNAQLVGVSGDYTSVPAHLDWILGQIGYAWTHGASQAVVRRGTGLQIFDEATERMCQYACDHTACVAYNYVPSLDRCTLLSSVTSIISSTTVRSDAK